MWQPHRLCGSHTRAVAVPQQHIVAVEKPQQLCWLFKEAIYCLKTLYVPAKQAGIRPENIESCTNRVGKSPFGLKLCAVRAVPLRMPPACLDCQTNETSIKMKKIVQFEGSGRQPYSCCALRGSAKR